MKCERCGTKAVDAQGQPDVFDYCAECSNNLCPACMEEGCCGNVPAHSGMREDNDASDAGDS